MARGCFITPGRSLQRAVELVKLADSLGYQACFTTHIAGWESLTVLAAYAAATQRIALGSGVVPIFTRTPATMAQTAVTLDELSGGRLRLGLGVSHQVVVENWHGQRIERPVAQMREYVSILKAVLAGQDRLEDRDVLPHLGDGPLDPLAVPVFHHHLVGDAKAEPQSAA